MRTPMMIASLGLTRLLAAWLCLLPALLAQEPRMMKVYDLRFLVAREAQLRAGERVLPGLVADEMPRTGSVGTDSVAALELAELTVLLRDAVGGTEADGTDLRAEGGVLFATADEAQHKKLAAWIELCRQVYLEQVTYEMHVLPGKLLSGGRGVLTRDEADALLRTAAPHPTFVASSRIGAEALLQTNDSTWYVRDHDVEVAQMATIPDPKLDVLVAGKAWSVATLRCLDGRLEVQVLGQQTDLLGTPRVLPFPSRDARGKQENGLLQLPTIHYVREGGRARLGDGEAMLFGADEGGADACLLRVKRPQSIALPSGADWAWVAVGDLVCGTMPPRSAHLRLEAAGDDAPWIREEERDPQPRTLEQATLIERLGNMLPADCLTHLPGGLLMIRGTDAQRKAATDMLSALAATMLKQTAVELRHGRLGAAEVAAVADGRLDVGELAGKLPASFLTPCILQDGFHRIAGIQRAYLRDYEVEIASDAASQNPVIGAVFSGISISGHVLQATRGQYRLGLEVSFAELVGEIEPFDLKDERFGPVELPHLRDIWFSVAPIIDANKWTLIYMAPLHGTNESFAVVARVRD